MTAIESTVQERTLSENGAQNPGWIFGPKCMSIT